MKWWCIPCCEPELPDIDINMSCPSACCVTNKENDQDTSETFSNQAKPRSSKGRKHVRKRRRRRQKQETK